MARSTAERILVSLPGELGPLIKARAKAGYRSASAEILMLVERGLAAEKAASAPTA